MYGTGASVSGALAGYQGEVVGGGAHQLGRTQRVLLEVSTVLYFLARNAAIPLIQQYVHFLVVRKYNFSEDYVERFSPLINEGVLLHMFAACCPTKEGEVKTSVAVNIASLEAAFGGRGRSQGQHNGSHIIRVPVPPVIRNKVEKMQELSNIVNEESSLIVFYLTIAELLPSAIAVLFLGCWSDATGRRKFLMWMPCLGNALYALGFLLPLYVAQGDIDSPVTMTLLVLACLCSGLSGNVPGFLSGRRTLRLSIVELSVGLTFGLAGLINGYWVTATSHFEQPLFCVLILSLVPFVILVGFLHEPTGEVMPQLGGGGLDASGGRSSPPTTVLSLRKNFHGIRHIFGLRTIAQRKLWSIFVAFQIYVFVQQGQERTFVLFLQSRPLYWKPEQIGLFFFILYTLAGFGSWPGVPLLQRCTSDLAITSIALLSKLLGSLLLAAATYSVIVYFASVIQIFHLVPFAIARSLVSQQMGEDEQGSVYALLHSVQAVVSFLGPVIHTAIFSASVPTHFSGLTFLASGPLLIISILLIGYTRYLEHLEENFFGVDGSSQRTKPFSPSSLSPLSESAGFVHRPADQVYSPGQPCDDEDK